MVLRQQQTSIKLVPVMTMHSEICIVKKPSFQSVKAPVLQLGTSPDQQNKQTDFLDTAFLDKALGFL